MFLLFLQSLDEISSSVCDIIEAAVTVQLVEELGPRSGQTDQPQGNHNEEAR